MTFSGDCAVDFMAIETVAISASLLFQEYHAKTEESKILSCECYPESSTSRQERIGEGVSETVTGTAKFKYGKR
jgi:hypothetical protein